MIHIRGFEYEVSYPYDTECTGKRKKEQEDYFTALLKCLNPETDADKGVKEERSCICQLFFEDKPLKLDSNV